MRFTKITTALCALFSGVLVRADFFERYYCHCANKDLVVTAFTFKLVSNRLKETFHWAETCENKRQYEWPPHFWSCHGELVAENCAGMPNPLDYGCGKAFSHRHTNDWTSPSGHTITHEHSGVIGIDDSFKAFNTRKGDIVRLSDCTDVCRQAFYPEYQDLTSNCNYMQTWIDPNAGEPGETRAINWCSRGTFDGIKSP
ncbi:hypothetical protein LTS18_000509 [Coniosporium uncinatum]|uniref:Uncharacterized protein n=1 Tax=Coniosporium uncinatum TaxID=93489 RepID=A0ACC3D8J1_9PEZI|nr:hypothetical protein LTS18_000509 [Coniosporium uncinatum]